MTSPASSAHAAGLSFPLTNGPFVAYTDGACKGNPGPGGWGVSLRDAAGAVLHESCGGQPHTTNNIMEMTGVIEALKLVAPGQTLQVFTDSQYVQKGLTEWIAGWKRKNWRTAKGDPVKNVELWRELDALAASRKLTLSWVRGHNGDPGNERADELSNQGITAR